METGRRGTRCRPPPPQDVRGDLPAGLDALVSGLDDRHPARHHRLRPAGAAAGDQLVAVALQQLDPAERDAEPRRQDLGKRRPVPLAVIEGAGDQGHAAVRLKADAAHLAAGRPGQFEIVADAVPAQFAVGPAFGLARGKAVPVGEPQRLVEQVGEVAAVIGRAVRRLVRHRLGRDVVLAAQFRPVDAGLGRGGVDQPLHVIVGLGAPGAPIGPDRGRVGEDALGRDLDQRRLVDPERVADRVARRRAGGSVGGAEVAVAVEADREKMAVLVERQLGGHVGVAAVAVGDKAARAVVGPFDRPAQFARGVQDAVVFGVGRLLHAKRAADPLGQDAHLVAADAKDAGDVVAKPEHALAADMQCPMLARGVEIGDPPSAAPSR